MTNLADPLQADVMIRLPEVLRQVGLSRSAWYRMIKDGEAPGPIRMTPKVAAWSQREISDFLEQRLAGRTTRVTETP